MMTGPVRIAVIGCGGITNAHASGFEAIGDDAKVVATFDVDSAAAQRLADRLGAEVSTNLEALLAREDVEAVDICLPHHLHALSGGEGRGGGQARVHGEAGRAKPR